MSTLLVDEIAGEIRRVDGGNMLTARVLGEAIDVFLRDKDMVADAANPYAVEDFIARKNLNKLMDAGHLAELIVAEFNLDKE
jgi:hypothetical protein